MTLFICDFICVEITFLSSAIFAIYSICVSGIYADIHTKRCIQHDDKNFTCTFFDIMDSFDFHRDLLRMANEKYVMDIEIIKFEDSFMDNIPKELTMVFRNLKELDVSGVELERLESYDFDGKTNMKQLNVSNNKLNKLNIRMTTEVKNLELLDMSYNQIERIHPYAFTYNENFKFFNLSHNRISKINGNFLAPLASLEILHLDHNLIEAINIKGFLFDSNLKELYLQNNKLATFDPFLFKNLNVLDLSRNRLMEFSIYGHDITELRIEDNELCSLRLNDKLEILQASGSKENVIEIDLSTNKALTYLDLSNLKLLSTEETFESIRKIESLKYLDLSENQIVINDKSFSQLKNLETLIIQKSINGNLPFNAFLNQENLIRLDLSENSIHFFNFEQLKKSTNLKILDISENQIYRIAEWRNVSTILPMLTEISFAGNILKCNELDEILRKFVSSKIKIQELNELGLLDFKIRTCVPDDLHDEISKKHEGESWTPIIVLFIVITLTIAILFVIGWKSKILKLLRPNSQMPRSSEELLNEDIEENINK